MSPFTSVNIPRGKMDHCKEHSFTTEELDSLKTRLLLWYEKSNRDLPWRKIVMYPVNILTELYCVLYRLELRQILMLEYIQSGYQK